MTARVLVRVPSWLGDLVASEPVLRALHEGAERGALALTLAGPAHLLPALDGALPRARRVAHESRSGERAADWRGHDVALLLANSFRSAWSAARAGIPRRIGWARDARAWLLTDAIQPARERGRAPLHVGRPGRWPRALPRPFGETCAELASLLGIAVRDTRPRLSASAAARGLASERLARAGLAPGEPFLLVNAGARAESAKAPPPERLADAAAAIVRAERLPVLGVCGPGEEPALGRFGGALARAAPEARFSAASKPTADLRELTALCERAALVLTPDTGPRHVAAACGARVLCLLGPTDPRHTASQIERTRLVRAWVPCGPCHRERCPLSGADALRCWRAFEDGDVAGAARELLALAPRASG